MTSILAKQTGTEPPQAGDFSYVMTQFANRD